MLFLFEYNYQTVKRDDQVKKVLSFLLTMQVYAYSKQSFGFSSVCTLSKISENESMKPSVFTRNPNRTHPKPNDKDLDFFKPIRS